MKLLTVPNWSFGRNKALLRRCSEALARANVTTHFCESDVDHNRTVTAFSGEHEAVLTALKDLAELALPGIDLNRHMGVHPRIGGLDVCPFVILDQADISEANGIVAAFAGAFVERWQVPVYLYEKSERGRHEVDLPSLRRAGFGSLAGRLLNPDFGPKEAHAQLGVSVMGIRDPLVAMNVNLRTGDISIAKEIAKAIRNHRAEGDVRFLGVRALAFALSSKGLTQVSLNLTLPDLTPIDPIVEWVAERATKKGVGVEGAELIGAIRPRDLEHATRLPYRPAQVVG